MAPIPRCDLRLPSVRRSLPPAGAAAADADDDLEDEVSAGADRVPLHAQRSQTRDSAQILEDSGEFSTSVTRDAAEIRDHKLHEEGGGAGLEEEEELDGTEGVAEAESSCAVLEQCRAEVEAKVATAAAAVIDAEDVTSSEATAAAIVPVATPGDMAADFCKDRAESPSSDYNLRAVVEADKFGQRKKAPKKCKGKYAPVEAYAGLWGGSQQVNARKKLELEMRKKRRFYERLHERNRKRRVDERRRAKENWLMMRCRDQAKILEAVDNISINKAFYFRFNYNKQLPCMPSVINEHLRKYKKPPFKHFPKGGLQHCRKEVDEFAKLRILEVKGGGGGITTLPRIKTKA